MQPNDTDKMLQQAAASGSELAPVFDLGFAPVAAKSAAEMHLGMARDALVSLQSKATQGVVRELADTAVSSDMLRGTIERNVQGDLGDAAGALQSFQQPLQVQAINTLGSALEAGQQFGVVPPTPETVGQMPLCVAIRAAAASGNLAPAFQAYRATAFPMRFTRGVAYNNAVDFIAQCLPAGSPLVDQFYASVQTMQNEPDNPPSDGLATAPGPTVTTSGGSPGGPSAAASGSQFSLPSLVPLASSGQGASSAPIQVQPAAGTGSDALCPWGRGLPTKEWSAGQSAADWVGKTLSCYGWTIQFMGCTNTDPPTIGYSARNGLGINVSDTLPFAPGTCPSGTGGSGGGDGGGSGGSGGQQQAVCPPPPPPKECCQAPACPPPQVIVNNIVEQKTQETKKETKTPRKYCAWCGADGVPYVIYEGDPPKNTGDTMLQCESSPLELDFSKCCQQQQQRQQRERITQLPPGPDFFPSIPGFNQQVGCDSLFSAPLLVGQWFPATFTETFRAAAEKLNIGGETGNLILDAAVQYLGPVVGGVVGTVADGLISVAQQLFATGECPGLGNSAVLTSRIVTGFMNKYVSSAFEHSDARLEYMQSFNCPWRLPSAAEATAAYLANAIDFERLQCLVKANGYDWINWEGVAEAARPKLGALQYGLLAQREMIPDAEFNLRLRQLGFIQDHDKTDVQNLLKQIPPASDIVRMMVRDSGDDQLAATFNLDADFGKKFNGQLKEWTLHQGIDEKYMQYLWRAHWSIPAPVQLQDMLHRLSRLPQNDPRYVDETIIRTAMEQQDIAPFWIDKFIATSYRPLTRIDARRAYEIGALNKDDLREAYLNLGYDSANADRLVTFNVRNVQRTLLRSPLVRKLANAEITNGEFDQQFRDLGADSDTTQKGIAYAQAYATASSRKLCVAALKKRFMQGEFDAGSAQGKVQALGIDPSIAATTVQGWQCQSDAGGKNLSASIVGQLYEAGLIDELSYVKRLQTLGISNDDAVALLRLLQRKLNIKATKAQADALRKEQAAQERLQRSLQRAANQAARSTRQQTTATNNIQNIRLLRTKRLMAAGEKFSTHSGLSIPDAITFIQSQYNQAINSMPLTNDEVIAALTTIAGDKQVSTQQAFSDALAAMLTVQA